MVSTASPSCEYLLAGADNAVAALRVGVHGGVRHAAHAVVVCDAVRDGLLSATTIRSLSSICALSLFSAS